MQIGFFLTVFLLWLFIKCSAINVCPPREDIEPCTCDPHDIVIAIKCRNLTNTDTLYDVFDKSDDYPFQVLEILNSTITCLPGTIVKKKMIRDLKIEGCVMTSLFDDRPDHADSLESLTLKDTRFLRGIEWNFFSSFYNLNRIYTINVELKKIGKLFKDNINSTMQYIRVVNGKTAVLEDDVFSTLTKLRGIEISKALIKTLKRSMFPAKSVLRFFVFRENLIRSLPEDIFSDMPDLYAVHLENNRLTTLPATIYVNVYKHPDCVLSFENNPVNCDCTILWFYPIEDERTVTGTCASPPSKKGKRLDSLSRKDFPQCCEA